ncbi:hypothetical protein [Blastococcus sp. CCUG 61487]|uniref:hypothetical protein n=1 Tax=Blastococcus sp. CCUG 61487 TaxID=1840703 RepID=UPI0010BFDC4F|nr:hypothetical protein [Blastococcus sp. CCUG 61487]TKJ24375.1 hypothetical protein A6V29_05090 [Blastococcus sp. CCUG 61487]
MLDRIKSALQQLRYTEPALLRARYVQIAGMLAALGLTVPGVVHHWVGVGLAAAAIAAPYYQGRKTRADVWSPATVDDLAAIAALFPGLIGRARQLLGAGMPAAAVIRQLEQESLADDPPGQHAADPSPR